MSDQTPFSTSVTADSYTNLFIGVFTGTILFGLTQISSTTRVLTGPNLWAFYSRFLVDIAYLIIGYYCLFCSYHRDSPTSRALLTRYGLRQSFTNILVFVILFLFAVSPTFLTYPPVYFYLFLSVLSLCDLAWLFLSNLPATYFTRMSSRFDLFTILLCAFFGSVYYIRPDVENSNSYSVVLNHLWFFAPIGLLEFYRPAPIAGAADDPRDS